MSEASEILRSVLPNDTLTRRSIARGGPTYYGAVSIKQALAAIEIALATGRRRDG